MLLISLSSRAWDSYEGASKYAIFEISENNHQVSVALDFDNINRIASERDFLETINRDFEIVDIIKLLKFGHREDYVIDKALIHKLSKDVESSSIILLKASDQDLELISSFLKEARKAWYELEVWHKSFVIVTQDRFVLDVSELMANTFYIQPESLSKSQLNRLVGRFYRQAIWVRRFGKRGYAINRWITKRMSWLIRVTEKISARSGRQA